ncbi:MAG: hypothetical protein HQL31_07270 [Planctomycetes bacterium]|nr:hypothetical protein [Planctomycetota bacterium]
MKPRNNRLTLVEIMMVSAILAILAALLQPALVKSLEKAKLALCMNNQKQLYLGMVEYCNDFSNYCPSFPFGQYSTPMVIYATSWYGPGVLDYFGYAPLSVADEPSRHIEDPTAMMVTKYYTEVGKPTNPYPGGWGGSNVVGNMFVGYSYLFMDFRSESKFSPPLVRRRFGRPTRRYDTQNHLTEEEYTTAFFMCHQPSLTGTNDNLTGVRNGSHNLERINVLYDDGHGRGLYTEDYYQHPLTFKNLSTGSSEYAYMYNWWYWAMKEDQSR